ncbi:MAG: peptidoglycan bridge formation glycyltransferase FemA/FemB family protein [Spirochaetaceae bacterium]|nr:MAG: peptidoglycan bridge formation glycyltransferase FemA/FemB family protein [Spirochaetaceae bacterium]
MKSRFPHFLQTPQWGLAKQKASPAWTPFFFIQTHDNGPYTPAPIEGTPGQPFSPGGINASILILERNMGFGQKILYVPRGPWIDWENQASIEQSVSFIIAFARERKSLLVRIEPEAFDTNFLFDKMNNLGFKKTPDFVQANDTVKVPIDKPDKELMTSFHHKHGYNIRLAEKRGLTVRTSTDPADVSRFYELLKKTESRHDNALAIHPLSYYLSVTETLAQYNMARLYLVEKENSLASASLVFTYGEEAIYMFGASDYEFRRDMPNHLREWTSMRDARDEGRKFFDLWGVTMRNDPGEGIKRYKLGYYEQVRNMAGTFDWASSKIKYSLFAFANKLRRRLH